MGQLHGLLLATLVLVILRGAQASFPQVAGFRNQTLLPNETYYARVSPKFNSTGVLMLDIASQNFVSPSGLLVDVGVGDVPLSWMPVNSAYQAFLPNNVSCAVTTICDYVPWIIRVRNQLSIAVPIVFAVSMRPTAVVDLDNPFPVVLNFPSGDFQLVKVFDASAIAISLLPASDGEIFVWSAFDSIPSMSCFDPSCFCSLSANLLSSFTPGNTSLCLLSRGGVNQTRYLLIGTQTFIISGIVTLARALGGPVAPSSTSSVTESFVCVTTSFLATNCSARTSLSCPDQLCDPVLKCNGHGICPALINGISNIDTCQCISAWTGPFCGCVKTFVAERVAVCVVVGGTLMIVTVLSVVSQCCWPCSCCTKERSYRHSNKFVVAGNAMMPPGMPPGGGPPAVGVFVNNLSNERLCNVGPLHFEPGKLVALMGPSGGGKSSLLKAILGEDFYCFDDDGAHVPTAIDGLFFNGDLAEAGLRCRSQVQCTVGYIPQDDILAPDLNVQQLLSTSWLTKRGTPVDNGVLDRVAQLLEIDGHLKKSIDSLSGGQRKRVSIAMEIVGGPRILLADEITASLDSHTAEKLVRFLRTFARHTTAVVICVIHQPSKEVLDLFDHVVVLRRRARDELGLERGSVAFSGVRNGAGPVIGPGALAGAPGTALRNGGHAAYVPWQNFADHLVCDWFVQSPQVVPPIPLAALPLVDPVPPNVADYFQGPFHSAPIGWPPQSFAIGQPLPLGLWDPLLNNLTGRVSNNAGIRGLFWRELYQQWGKKTITLGYLLLSLLLGIVLGVIYKTENYKGALSLDLVRYCPEFLGPYCFIPQFDPIASNAVVSVMAVCFIAVIFSSFTFKHSEMVAFEREAHAMTFWYRLVFGTVKMIADLVIGVCAVAFFSLPWYFLTNPASVFGWIFGPLCLAQFCATGMTYIFMLLSDYGLVISVTVLLVSIMLSGANPPLSTLGGLAAAFSYITFPRYVVEMIFINNIDQYAGIYNVKASYDVTGYSYDDAAYIVDGLVLGLAFVLGLRLVALSMILWGAFLQRNFWLCFWRCCSRECKKRKADMPVVCPFPNPPPGGPGPGPGPGGAGPPGGPGPGPGGAGPPGGPGPGPGGAGPPGGPGPGAGPGGAGPPGGPGPGPGGPVPNHMAIFVQDV